MYCVMFIFKSSQEDAEFHRLNELVDRAAQASDGYLGVEKWTSQTSGLFNAIYYWSSIEKLGEFSRNRYHLEAKKKYRAWYDGYQIVVAEVKRSYGDGRIPHLSVEPKGSIRGNSL